MRSRPARSGPVRSGPARSRSRGLPAVAAVLVVAMVCAGCGGGDPGRRAPGAAAPTTAASGASGSASSGAQQPGAGRCPLGPLPDPPADRPDYHVRVDLQPARKLVVGDLRVRFTPDFATDRLVFRLWPNNQHFRAAGAKLDAGPVSSGGRRVASSRPNPTTLEVRPGGALEPGRSIEVSLPWRLTLPSSPSDRIDAEGGALRLGSFFPLLAWQPGVGWATDPPASGLGEASTSPSADFDVTVTAPAGLGVLATGTNNGQGSWKATAVRDFALSAGRFRTASAVARAPNDVRVTVGVAEGLQDDPAGYVRTAVRALEDYAKRFAPYPWQTLTVGITPDLAGGIEYPTHIMQGPGTVNEITPHEVGHMWFYSLVGNDQARDPWLDEGLAT